MKRTPFANIFVLIAFLLNTVASVPLAQAQDYHLPQPGVMVHLSPPIDPPMLKGIKIHPENPLQFDFILDKGDSELSNEQVKDESSKLIKYFLASLTIPEKDLWVNLSPYERDRIIPNSFGLTEMGRDLLAEDYMLKQITASLIYPEDEIGKKFWKRIYEEAQERYGTTNIPVNTFNKVWIVPEKAVVYENAKAGTAYVVESKLKVMLEEDYLSLEKHEGIQSDALMNRIRVGGDVNALGSQIVREIVLPELTQEVNENKNFSHLRQVYNSLILATWYKTKIKDSILSQVYEDKAKVAGVNIDDPKEKEKIYQQYLKAFKKGVFNYIKDDLDVTTEQMIPRKYFSGGMNMAMNATSLGSTTISFISNKSFLNNLTLVNKVAKGALIMVAASLFLSGQKTFAQQIPLNGTEVSGQVRAVIQHREINDPVLGKYTVDVFTPTDLDKKEISNGIKGALDKVQEKINVINSQQNPGANDLLILNDLRNRLIELQSNQSNLEIFKASKTKVFDLEAFTDYKHPYVSVDYLNLPDKLVNSIIHESLHPIIRERYPYFTKQEEENMVISWTLKVLGPHIEVKLNLVNGKYEFSVYSLDPNLSQEEMRNAIQQDINDELKRNDLPLSEREFLLNSKSQAMIVGKQVNAAMSAQAKEEGRNALIALNRELNEIARSRAPEILDQIRDNSDRVASHFIAVLRHALNTGNSDLINELEERLNSKIDALRFQSSSMPTMDEKLAYIITLDDSPDYLERVGKLVNLNRPLAAVLLFAANGPHTRREFLESDKDDVEAQKILINGFIGHLKELFEKLNSLKEGDLGYAQVLAETQKYAGGLLNGLLMRTHLTTEQLVDEISAAITDPSINLKEIIRQSMAFFPEDEEDLPRFMKFVGEISGAREFEEIGINNSQMNQQVTGQQVFLGVPNEDADKYMELKEEITRIQDRQHNKQNDEQLRVADIDVTKRAYKELRDLSRDSGASSENAAMKAVLDSDGKIGVPRITDSFQVGLYRFIELTASTGEKATTIGYATSLDKFLLGDNIDDVLESVDNIIRERSVVADDKKDYMYPVLKLFNDRYEINLNDLGSEEKKQLLNIVGGRLDDLIFNSWTLILDIVEKDLGIDIRDFRDENLKVQILAGAYRVAMIQGGWRRLEDELRNRNSDDFNYMGLSTVNRVWRIVSIYDKICMNNISIDTLSNVQRRVELVSVRSNKLRMEMLQAIPIVFAFSLLSGCGFIQSRSSKDIGIGIRQVQIAPPEISVFGMDQNNNGKITSFAPKPAALISKPEGAYSNFLTGLTVQEYLDIIISQRHQGIQPKQALMYYWNEDVPQSTGASNLAVWSIEDLKKLKSLGITPFVGLETIEPGQINNMVQKLKDAGYGQNDRIYIRVAAEPDNMPYGTVEGTPDGKKRNIPRAYEAYHQRFEETSAYLRRLAAYDGLNFRIVYVGNKDYQPNPDSFDALGADLYITPDPHTESGDFKALKELAANSKKINKPVVFPEFGIATGGSPEATPEWAEKTLRKVISSLDGVDVEQFTYFSVDVPDRVSDRTYSWAITPEMIQILEQWSHPSKVVQRKPIVQGKLSPANAAMNAEDRAMNGGIDLTPANMHLQTQNAGEAIKFHLNPAMLAQLQNAPGFVPVIINIQPMTDLRRFLGITADA